jgi:hypothetical protein
MKKTVILTKKVQNLVETLPYHSHLAFNEFLNQLKQRECLPEEIKLDEQHSTYLLVPTGELILIHRKVSKRLWQTVLLVTILDLKPPHCFQNFAKEELLKIMLSHSQQSQSITSSIFKTLTKVSETAERIKFWSEVIPSVVGLFIGLLLVAKTQFSLADKLPKQIVPAQQPSQNLRGSSQSR